jgi:pyruvate/2-oxoglutarate dehydrogenase complex dihydrolipoamide dehydrogenase (E3) component
VIGVGRISHPDVAEAAIARGDADLISFGRQHLTDPGFIGKIKAGNLDDVRWCVACNQGCIERLSFEMKSTTCTFNPSCGYEIREKLPSDSSHSGSSPADTDRKRIWIIGAGPAGLSAALSASECGHVVEVFEKDDNPGGQLSPASTPPRKEAFMDWVNWAMRQLKKRGVPVRFQSKVTSEHFQEKDPDAVILATGSFPVAAPIPGIDQDHVFDARDVLTGKAEITSPAVVLGAGYVGMETADFLLAHGVKVAVIEMKPTPPVGKMTAHGYWLHKRIREAGGRIMFGATVKAIGPEGVVYLQNEDEGIEPAAMVVTAMGARPGNALEETLRQLGMAHRTVGDAKSPRRLFEAIHEGHRAGREV